MMSCLKCTCGGEIETEVASTSSSDLGIARCSTSYQLLMRVKSESFALVDKPLGMVSFPPTQNDYKKWSHLGSVCGGIGAVWAATHKPSNETVAIKIYNLDKCGEELELIQHEISMAKQLRHQNIMPYISSFISSQQLWIVMPLMGYTSAAHLVASSFPDGMPEHALVLIIKDVLNGLQYLHSKGIIHRAIKGSHILIRNDGTCALSGLRHSITRISHGKWLNAIHSYPTQAKYNLNWLSPEILEQNLLGYCEKSDIYSLGIAMCELANGEVPFSRIEETMFMFLQKFEGVQPFIYDATTYEEYFSNGDALGDSCDGSLQDNLMSVMNSRRFSNWAHQFLRITLAREPCDRLAASQLLQHQFIKQARKFNTNLSQILNTVLTCSQENTGVIQRWANHFESLLNVTDGRKVYVMTCNERKMPVVNKGNDDLTHEEVLGAVKQSKGGESNIPDLLEENFDQMSINEETHWEF